MLLYEHFAKKTFMQDSLSTTHKQGEKGLRETSYMRSIFEK